LNAGGLVITCIGAVRVCVAEVAGVVEDRAWDATAWRSDAASCGSGDVVAAGTGALGEGRRYIASIVGRMAAPNGVDRKSVGRSRWVVGPMRKYSLWLDNPGTDL
jgi:hypothetical protein